MKARFWHDRWEADQLGFHQAEVNGLLTTRWPSLDVAPDRPVFVPLCGKSLDMRWLRERGHPVVGVEFSPIAIRDFFEEAGLDVTPEKRGAFDISRSDGYRLYCGDFFELTRKDLEGVGGVYDRAALIALPPETRIRYARHLAEILPTSASILMITLDYDQTRMDGPPHSVPTDEVERLFGEAFEIDPLFSSGPQPPTDHFRERGLEVWTETVWRLRRGDARR